MQYCLASQNNWPKISIIYFTSIFLVFFKSPISDFIFLFVPNPGLSKIYFHAKFQEDSYKNEKDLVLKNHNKIKYNTKIRHFSEKIAHVKNIK